MFSASVQLQNAAHIPHLKDTAPESFYSIIGILIVFILLATRSAFKTLATYRAVKGIPTSLIRSAAQGDVELHGTQTCPLDKPLTSPLTFSSCTWYDYTIQQKITTVNNQVTWQTIYQNTSTTPIMLRDKTGECWILPEQAQVSTPDIFMRYENSGTPWNKSYPANQPLGSLVNFLWHTFNILTIGSLSAYLRNRPYRHIEKIMKANDRIYALGFFCSYHDAEQNAFMGRLNEWIPSAHTPGTKNVLSASENNHTPFLLSSNPEKKLMREQLWAFLLWLGLDVALFVGLVFFVAVY